MGGAYQTVRVAHREAAAEGGLHVQREARRLDDLFRASESVVRCGRWRAGYETSFYHHLRAAMRELAGREVT